MHYHNQDCWRVGKIKANVWILDINSQTTVHNLAKSTIEGFPPQATILRFKKSDRLKKKSMETMQRIIMKDT